MITGYRNKSEFTVGRNVKGEPCVGFVSGKMAERRCIIVPVDECVNFSENTRRIVRAFEEVVKNSGTCNRLSIKLVASYGHGQKKLLKD